MSAAASRSTTSASWPAVSSQSSWTGWPKVGWRPASTRSPSTPSTPWPTLSLANTMGLGRLQPHLDDPEVQDIHVRGSESTWLKLRDGRRCSAPPVVDRDEELIDLVRLVATRMGRTERRFDAAAPELNFQLPDGSRLFAVMDVSTHPSVIVRKHLFSLSALAELENRGMLDDELRAFLTAAVRARRNLILTGGTGSGKTTLSLETYPDVLNLGAAPCHFPSRNRATPYLFGVSRALVCDGQTGLRETRVSTS